jgi:hypothetical protein
MLHNINAPDCAIQFEAIKQLQRNMLDLACNPTTPNPLTQAAIAAKFGAAGTWMWERLYIKSGKQTKLGELVVAVVDYASTNPALHQAVLDSFDNDIRYHEHIDDTTFRFQYEVLVAAEARTLIRPLMEAFYENLLANGFPHCVHGLADDFHRDALVRAFWDANPGLNVCPACGGLRPDAIDAKRYADTDHFLPKSIYPFLSVHAANLLPICLPCNRSFKTDANAGDDSARVDPLDEAANAPLLHTFLPYLRSALGFIDISVSRDGRSVHECNITDQDGTISRRVNNLNRVLRLKKRWNDRLSVIIGEIYSDAAALGRRDRRIWSAGLTEQDLRIMAEEWIEDRERLIKQQPEFLLRESYLRFVLEDDNEFADLFTVYAEPAS